MELFFYEIPIALVVINLFSSKNRRQKLKIKSTSLTRTPETCAKAWLHQLI